MNHRPAAALVREPSPRLAEALLTFQDRRPIDLDRATRQHDAYRRLLAGLGLEVVVGPAAPDHPDGVFVEDTAVVIDDLAVLTRPGALARRAEPATLGPLLGDRGLTVVRLEPPARLDGGDVLAVDDVVYVGLGARTDAGGAAQLATAIAGRQRRVVEVPVSSALHLKTAVTALPDGTLLGTPDRFDIGPFDGRRLITAPEPSGANVLVVGDTVVVAASAPRTAATIAARGVDVEVVDIGEFEKAEAGLTCLSVLLPRSVISR